jgi:predicted metal-binding membrane protein
VVTRPAAVVRHHPEAYAASVVGLAWLALLLLGGRHQVVSAAPDHAMPGMGVQGDGSLTLAGLGSWTAMAVAMMGPVALAAARHVGVNALRWRRQRAIAEFGLAYVSVWTLAGVAILALVAEAPSWTWWFVSALTLAAGWQLTPMKRRALQACHRTVPLRPRGWPARRSCLAFGLRHGAACVASCWPLMVAMTFVTAGQLLWTAAFAALIVAERVAEHPFHVARHLALPLLAAAVAGAVVAI